MSGETKPVKRKGTSFRDSEALAEADSNKKKAENLQNPNKSGEMSARNSLFVLRSCARFFFFFGFHAGFEMISRVYP